MKQVKGFNRLEFDTGKRFNSLKDAVTGRFKTGQYLTEPGHSGFKYVVRSYKIGAGQRGIDFLLSESQIKVLTKSDCYYCGAPPSQEAFCVKQRTKEAHQRSKYIYNGIDRIDNAKPYVKENCVPCCRICNRAKGNLPAEKFISYLNQLIQQVGGVPYPR